MIGAGLAGLACAAQLHAAGVDVLLLERGDAVGGRVRTDHVDGFTLDRGFQVMLTAYPRASAALDLDALDLRAFRTGALIYTREGWQRLDDAFRRPGALLAALRSRAATLRDKLRILRLRVEVSAPPLADLFERPERPTHEELRRRGFSRTLRERFFEPFTRGVFLERELATSSRFFEFVIRMFAKGDAAVPADGMQAIAHQLASRLPEGAVRTGVHVAAVEPGDPVRVTLEDGRAIGARAVVLAMPRAAAATVLGQPATDDAGRSVTCVYYGAARSPVGEPTLLLDGEDEGPVNNLAVMSDVAPSYAPAGEALISATVLGNPAYDDAELDRRCRAQLERWFGPEVSAWRTLRIYRIDEALPAKPAMVHEPEPHEAAEGLWLAGDYQATPSIEGAIASGRATADAIAAVRSPVDRAPDLPAGRPTFSATFEVAAPLEAVAAFHEGPDALTRLQPPLSGTRFERVDPLAEGSITEFVMGRWPARIRWRAVHRDVEPGAGFTDVQQRGPMRSWVHRHEYRRVDGSRTRVTDRIWYEHPSGGRGVLTRGLFNSVLLASLFRYRAWATRRAVEAG
ncbi:MAG: FAD-dependent oxidoreductase [Chloroflexi bacterium]|nr:FAD-dependent oxidoreductase [Chloroflexota bacterium]